MRIIYAVGVFLHTSIICITFWFLSVTVCFEVDCGIFYRTTFIMAQQLPLGLVINKTNKIKVLWKIAYAVIASLTTTVV